MQSIQVEAMALGCIVMNRVRGTPKRDPGIQAQETAGASI